MSIGKVAYRTLVDRDYRVCEAVKPFCETITVRLQAGQGTRYSKHKIPPDPEPGYPMNQT